jgi:hypothetical protein
MVIADWELESLKAKYRKWKFHRRDDDGVLFASRDGFDDCQAPSMQLLEAAMGRELGRQQLAVARTAVPGLYG